MTLPLELALKVFKELAILADLPDASRIHGEFYLREYPPVDKKARQTVLTCSSLCRTARTDLLPLIFHRIDDKKLDRPQVINILLEIIDNNPSIAPFIASLRLGVRINYLKGSEWAAYDAAMNFLLLRLQDTLIELQLWCIGDQYYPTSLSKGIPQILARGRLQSLIYLDCMDGPAILEGMLPNLRSLHIAHTHLKDCTAKTLFVINLTIVTSTLFTLPLCHFPYLDTLALDVGRMILAGPIIRQAPNLRRIICLYVPATGLAFEYRYQETEIMNDTVTRLDWELASRSNIDHNDVTMGYRDGCISMLSQVVGTLQGLQQITIQLHTQRRITRYGKDSDVPADTSEMEGWGDWESLDKALDKHPISNLLKLEFDLTHLDLELPQQAASKFRDIINRDMSQMRNRGIDIHIISEPCDKQKRRVGCLQPVPRDVSQCESPPLPASGFFPTLASNVGSSGPPSLNRLWTFSQVNLPVIADPPKYYSDSEESLTSLPDAPTTSDDNPSGRKGKMKALVSVSNEFKKKIGNIFSKK